MGLRDDVERWTSHAGMRMTQVEDPDSTFHVMARLPGSGTPPVDVFEPAGQPGVMVVGTAVVLKSGQTGRYLRYNRAEKEAFEGRITGFCNSIRAVSRILTEDGRIKVGVYVVIDGGGPIRQGDFERAVEEVQLMHEKTTRFMRTL